MLELDRHRARRMRPATRKVIVSAAAAVLVSAGALLASPAPARAADCVQYYFDGRFAFETRSANGYVEHAEFTANHTSSFRNYSAVAHPFNVAWLGESRTDNLGADIIGRKVHMTATWFPGPVAWLPVGYEFVYDGWVNDNDMITGTVHDVKQPNLKWNWRSTAPLPCARFAPPPPPPPPGKTVRLGQPEISVNTSMWLLGVLTVNFHEAWGEDADCTYRITPRPPSTQPKRDGQFHLAPNGDVPATFYGAYPSSSTFDVVVSCANFELSTLTFVY